MYAEDAHLEMYYEDRYTTMADWDVEDERDYEDDGDMEPAREVPADFPVRVLGPDDPAADRCTCGTCHRSWDDAIVTEWTPVPSARCPFEYYH